MTEQKTYAQLGTRPAVGDWVRSAVCRVTSVFQGGVHVMTPEYHLFSFYLNEVCPADDWDLLHEYEQQNIDLRCEVGKLKEKIKELEAQLEIADLDYEDMEMQRDRAGREVVEAAEALGLPMGEWLVPWCEEVIKERDELQAALAEQMRENGRLSSRIRELNIPPPKPTMRLTAFVRQLDVARDAYNFAVEELKREAAWRKHYENRLMKESCILNPPKICYQKPLAEDEPVD